MASQRHIRLVTQLPPDPVLAAAHASILDVGLRRTTLAEVARRARVSRMTVYRQWGDLDAIVAALLTRELVGAMQEANRRALRLPTGLQRLVGSCVEAVTAVGANPLYRRILGLDPELLLPLVTDRLGATQRAAVELLAVQIRNGRRDGTVRRGTDARRLAVGVVITLQSFVFSVRVLEDEGVGGVMERELTALLTGWLAA